MAKPPPEPDATTASNVVFDGGMPADDSTVPPQRCVIDTDYLAKHRTCSVDADCEEFSYEHTCCPETETWLIAVAKVDLEEVKACADRSKPICGSCPPGLTRAEDGRVVSKDSPATLRCVDKKCASSVGQRSCGSQHTCGPTEICVIYENVAGGIPPDPDSTDNTGQTFRCVPNPCEGELACECVQPICDARDDAERKCEIERNAGSDVTCSAYHD